jgi:hypothetical protein
MDSFYFSFPLQQSEYHLTVRPYCCNRKIFKMASDLTFSEGVAVATLVFTILAVLVVLPYQVVHHIWFSLAFEITCSRTPSLIDQSAK